MERISIRESSRVSVPVAEELFECVCNHFVELSFKGLTIFGKRSIKDKKCLTAPSRHLFNRAVNMLLMIYFNFAN